MTPIIIEFDVRADPGHAFSTWTDRCGMWWPPSHSMSGAPGFEVVFEPRVGGRIYEVGVDGSEHEWGEVTEWDPPNRLTYRWHIFLDRERATDVVITFTPSEAGTTVRLENSGFEVFGDGREERAGRVGDAWRGILDRYGAAFPS
jgi:uncharacterized protein YndB with AHSA1/START domain